MNNQIYHDYTTFLRDRYGGRIYRIALDIGTSCPNRSGPLDKSCTYCSDGSRAGYVRPGMTLAEQVERGVASARERYDPDGFLAYFQSFSSTFLSADRLGRCCREVLSLIPFAGLIISTRPDCLSVETLDLFSELNRETDLWVEIGIQTVHDRTLLDVRRGHDFACSRRAVEELSERGIKAVAHVILGLPRENSRHFSETAEVLAQLPLSGIKIHNLHVVENTPLAGSWRQGDLRTMDEREYAEVLVDFLRRIPAHWPVMRLVSDTPYRDLLAPRWSLSKGEFVKYFTRRMLDHGWRQGDLLEDSDSRDGVGVCGPQISVLGGSSGVEGPSDSSGGIEIARGLVEACGFPLKGAVAGGSPASHGSQTGPPGSGVSLPDGDGGGVCDGGASVLIVAFGEVPAVFEQLRSLSLQEGFFLEITGLMKDPGILQKRPWPVPGGHALCEELMRKGRTEWEYGRLQLFCGDPRHSIIRFEGPADAIILEPVAAELHPEIFTVDYLRCLRDLLAPSGILVSPSSEACVRNALHRIGLEVGMCCPEFIPRGGTAAAANRDPRLHELKHKDMRIMASTLSGVPYRDPGLAGSRKRILAHRRDVIAQLERRGWPERVLIE